MRRVEESGFGVFEDGTGRLGRGDPCLSVSSLFAEVRSATLQRCPLSRTLLEGPRGVWSLSSQYASL